MGKNSFFEQYIEVDSTYKWSDRLELFKNYIQDMNVLHVGCVDYPITDPNNNLHLQMSKICKTIDGFDINLTDELSTILKVDNGDLYNSWDKVNKHYDIVLVPAVIEHVDNVQLFLEQLGKINTDKMIITAPDIFSFKKEQLKHIDNNKWVEIVHPDHNCWYSPYTLKNTVTKFLKSYNVTSVFWILGCVGVVCEKQK
jgi:Methyltransferase domain